MIIATKTPSFRFFDLPKKEMEIIEKTLPSNISKTTVSLLTHIKCFPKHPLRPFKSTLYKLLFHIRQAGIFYNESDFIKVLNKIKTDKQPTWGARGLNDLAIPINQAEISDLKRICETKSIHQLQAEIHLDFLNMQTTVFLQLKNTIYPLESDLKSTYFKSEILMKDRLLKEYTSEIHLPHVPLNQFNQQSYEKISEEMKIAADKILEDSKKLDAHLNQIRDEANQKFPNGIIETTQLLIKFLKYEIDLNNYQTNMERLQNQNLKTKVDSIYQLIVEKISTITLYCNTLFQTLNNKTLFTIEELHDALLVIDFFYENNPISNEMKKEIQILIEKIPDQINNCVTSLRTLLKNYQQNPIDSTLDIMEQFKIYHDIYEQFELYTQNQYSKAIACMQMSVITKFPQITAMFQPICDIWAMHVSYKIKLNHLYDSGYPSQTLSYVCRYLFYETLTQMKDEYKNKPLRSQELSEFNTDMLLNIEKSEKIDQLTQLLNDCFQLNSDSLKNCIFEIKNKISNGKISNQSECLIHLESAKQSLVEKKINKSDNLPILQELLNPFINILIKLCDEVSNIKFILENIETSLTKIRLTKTELEYLDLYINHKFQTKPIEFFSMRFANATQQAVHQVFIQLSENFNKFVTEKNVSVTTIRTNIEKIKKYEERIKAIDRELPKKNPTDQILKRRQYIATSPNVASVPTSPNSDWSVTPIKEKSTEDKVKLQQNVLFQKLNDKKKELTTLVNETNSELSECLSNYTSFLKHFILNLEDFIALFQFRSTDRLFSDFSFTDFVFLIISYWKYANDDEFNLVFEEKALNFSVVIKHHSRLINKNKSQSKLKQKSNPQEAFLNQLKEKVNSQSEKNKFIYLPFENGVDMNTEPSHSIENRHQNLESIFWKIAFNEVLDRNHDFQNDQISYLRKYMDDILCQIDTQNENIDSSFLISSDQQRKFDLCRSDNFKPIKLNENTLSIIRDSFEKNTFQFKFIDYLIKH